VLVAGGHSWIRRAREAASEIPPDLDLTDDEEEDPDSSMTDTEEMTLPSAPPMEEDDAGLEEMIAGLRGPALQQVRRYVAVLARMRKDLTPSARAHKIKELGWHLGPTHKTGEAGRESNEPEPTWLLDGTGWIMNRLATIREQKQQAREERLRAMQGRLAMLDDGLADTEERLAKKREAELRARTKEIERRLPVITAQLGLLWHEVTGSGRPTPSGMQPSEEHLADAEVHLKLVRAHLAVLEPVGQVEVNLIEMVSPPAPKVPTKETGSVSTAAQKVPNRRAKAASAERKGDSTEEAEVVFVSRGRTSLSGARMASPRREAGKWACPINECREAAAHPSDSCKVFGDLSVTKRRKALKERNL
jgi:hypothetical protein